jgi:hypothetical protein
MATKDLEEPYAHFQAFRAPGEKGLIQIPVVLHPTLNELYVIWSDISDCFPEATRIQFQNVFVPKLRDPRLYRYFIALFFIFLSRQTIKNKGEYINQIENC